MAFSDGTIVINTKLETDQLNKKLKSVGQTLIKAFSLYALINFGKASVQLASDLQEVQNVVEVSFGSMQSKIENFAKTSIENFGMSELTAKKTASVFMSMGKAMGFSEKNASDMSIKLTELTSDMSSFLNLSFDEANTALKSIYTGETETLKRYGIVMTQVNLQEFARQEGITKSIQKMTQQEQVALRYNYVLKQTSLMQGDFARTSDSWANQQKILTERFKKMQVTFGKLFIAIGQLIMPVIQSVISGLNAIGELAIIVAQTLYLAFTGKKLDVSVGAGEAEQELGFIEDTSVAIEDTVAGQEDFNKEMDKTAKKQKNLLAGFDDIKVLTQDTAEPDSGSGGTGGIGGVGGTGDITVPNFEVTTGVDITADTSNFIKKIQELVEPLKQIDFTNLNNSLQNLKTSLEPLTKTLFQALEWAYYNIFVPLTKWTIEDFLPAFLNAVSSALDLLSSIIEPFKPLFLWLWDNFLQPIASWTGGLIVDILIGIEIALKNISDWIDNNQQLFITMTMVVGGFFLAWKVVELMSFIQISGGLVGALKNIGEWVRKGTINKLKDLAMTIQLKLLYAGDFIKSIFGLIKALFLQTLKFIALIAQKLIAIATTILYNTWTLIVTASTWLFNVALFVLTSPIALVVIGIVALIGVVMLLVTNWNKVKETAENIWNKVKEIWGMVAIWFNDKVLEPIKKALNSIRDFFVKIWDTIKGLTKNFVDSIGNFFVGLWQGIKNVCTNIGNAFSSMWEGIKTASKNAINWLLSGVENYFNFFIRGINGLINAVNKIQITMPEWIPLIGGNTFGFSIPTIPNLALPRLAKGAVLPPNQEFLAVLGDQKNGRNLEAPESLIRDIFRQEFSKNQISPKTPQQEIIIKFTGNMASLVRLLKPELDKENSRKGKKIVVEGS